VTIAGTRNETASAAVTMPRPVHVHRTASGGGRSRVGVVTVAVAIGLLIGAFGVVLSRDGARAEGLDLYFVGIAVVFASCAWRLFGTAAGRTERLQVSILLGLGLVIIASLSFPLIPDAYDEMLHETTLWQIVDLRTLFSRNTVLPVSPYYPGLELETAAVRWLTGMPLVAAEYVVVGLSRLVLVVALFLFVERVTHSDRAAGLAVVVYAIGPQFFSFNAAYAYQTIALAFGAATIYFLLVAAQAKTTREQRIYGALSLAAMAATTVSHHLVGWLTLGMLVVWAVASSLEARGDPAKRTRAHVIRNVAAGSVLISGAWTAGTAHLVVPYLSPIFSAGVGALAGLLSHFDHHRRLFHSSAGTVTPHWQEALIILSVVVSMAIIAAGLWEVLVRRGLPGRFERLIPVVVSLGYVVVLASPLEGASSQIGQRGSTFVFFGIALMAATWFMRRRPWVWAITAVATAAFVGSLIFGSGPSWSYVPGPFVPAADARSIDAPSIAAADWASAHLPVGSRIAADRDNAALMASVGHLSPVTEADGEVNVGIMYFAPRFGGYETATIRRYRIRYLLVDQRLADGPPAAGFYFEPGVPGPNAVDRLTKAELDKFANVPGIRRIYDNGPIQIYSTAGLLGAHGPATRTPPIGQAGTGFDLWVVVPALAVIGLWVLRAARRRKAMDPERALALLVAAMAGAIAVMFAYVPTKLDTVPLAWVVLAVLGALAVRGIFSDRRFSLAAASVDRASVDRASVDTASSSGGARQASSRVQHMLVGLGLAAMVVAGAIAVVSARNGWAPVTSLAVSGQRSAQSRPGRVADVTLDRADRGHARLEVLLGTRVVLTKRLLAVTSQQVALPGEASRGGARLALVVHGRIDVEVAG